MTETVVKVYLVGLIVISLIEVFALLLSRWRLRNDSGSLKLACILFVRALVHLATGSLLLSLFTSAVITSRVTLIVAASALIGFEYIRVALSKQPRSGGRI